MTRPRRTSTRMLALLYLCSTCSTSAFVPCGPAALVGESVSCILPGSEGSIRSACSAKIRMRSTATADMHQGDIDIAHGFLRHIVEAAETARTHLDFLNQVADEVPLPGASAASETNPPVSAAAVTDYLAALGGAPVKKMPPRGKPKTAERGTGYLDNMGSTVSSPAWSSVQHANVPAPSARIATSAEDAQANPAEQTRRSIQLAHAYLTEIVEAADTARGYLDYLGDVAKKTPLPDPKTGTISSPNVHSPAASGTQYLAALGGDPVKKMPPRGKPKSAARGAGYLDKIGTSTTPSHALSSAQSALSPEAPATSFADSVAAPATYTNEAVDTIGMAHSYLAEIVEAAETARGHLEYLGSVAKETPLPGSRETSMSSSSPSAPGGTGIDYLSALGGAPVKKIPPRGKPKTATRGLGYLDNMGCASAQTDWSSGRGRAAAVADYETTSTFSPVDSDAPASTASGGPGARQNIVMANDYLTEIVQAAETAKSYLDYLGEVAKKTPVPGSDILSIGAASLASENTASVDYLAMLSGGPVKKMPPRGKSKTAARGIGYLDNMGSVSEPTHLKSARSSVTKHPLETQKELTSTHLPTLAGHSGTEEEPSIRMAHGYLSEIVAAAKSAQGYLEFLGEVASEAPLPDLSAPSKVYAVQSNTLSLTGANYLATLGGGPVKKMPPRGKPKTATGQTGYLQTMGSAAASAIWSNSHASNVVPAQPIQRGPLDGEQIHSVENTQSAGSMKIAHGFLIEIVKSAKTAQGHLEYLANVAKKVPVPSTVISSSLDSVSGSDYLAVLDGGPVKKMPPRGKPKTAARGTSYLDNMDSVSLPMETPKARGQPKPDSSSQAIASEFTQEPMSEKQDERILVAHGYLTEIVGAAESARGYLEYLGAVAKKTTLLEAPVTRAVSVTPSGSGVDYMASLGGDPLRKMLPRGKSKITTRGTGYLDNMGQNAKSIEWSSARRDEVDPKPMSRAGCGDSAQHARVAEDIAQDSIKQAHGFLVQIVEAAETARGHLDYFGEVARAAALPGSYTRPTPDAIGETSASNFLSALGGSPESMESPVSSSTYVGTQQKSFAAASGSVPFGTHGDTQRNIDIAHGYLTEIVDAAKTSRQYLDYLDGVARVVRSHLRNIERGANAIAPQSSFWTQRSDLPNLEDPDQMKVYLERVESAASGAKQHIDDIERVVHHMDHVVRGVRSNSSKATKELTELAEREESATEYLSYLQGVALSARERLTPVVAATDYLKSLGGGPITKRPPRGKPKTGARGTGYLDSMGSENTLSSWSSRSVTEKRSETPSTGPVVRDDFVSFDETTKGIKVAHGYLKELVEAASTAQGYLEYLGGVAEVASHPISEDASISSSVPAVAASSGTSYLATLDGLPVKKMPPRGKPKAARRGTGYLDNMGTIFTRGDFFGGQSASDQAPLTSKTLPEVDWSSPRSMDPARLAKKDFKVAHGYLTEIVEAANTAREYLEYLGQVAKKAPLPRTKAAWPPPKDPSSYATSGTDYLVALGGGPVKKMPPRGKPKTSARGTGYLDTMDGNAAVSSARSSLRATTATPSYPPDTGPRSATVSEDTTPLVADVAKTQQTIEMAHAYLVEIVKAADTARSYLDYLGEVATKAPSPVCRTASKATPDVRSDYLASLGGTTVKKMPPRGIPKAAEAGTGYLDKMGSGVSSSTGHTKTDMSKEAFPDVLGGVADAREANDTQDGIRIAHGYLREIVEAAGTARGFLEYLGETAKKVPLPSTEAESEPPLRDTTATVGFSPDYLKALGGGPVKKVPPRGKPKTAARGTGYLENMGVPFESSAWSAVRELAPPVSPEMRLASADSEASSTRSAAVGPGTNYLAALGGDPVKKMPPRGKNKTATGNAGYLDSMGTKRTAWDWSNAPVTTSTSPSDETETYEASPYETSQLGQPDTIYPYNDDRLRQLDDAPVQKAEETLNMVYGYLSEIVDGYTDEDAQSGAFAELDDADKSYLSYLKGVADSVRDYLTSAVSKPAPPPVQRRRAISVASGPVATSSDSDYLTALGGSPVKKMPPRGKPKTAQRGTGYLENMGSAGLRPDWSSFASGYVKKAEAALNRAYGYLTDIVDSSRKTENESQVEPNEEAVSIVDLEVTVNSAKEFLSDLEYVTQSTKQFLNDPSSSPLPDFKGFMGTRRRDSDTDPSGTIPDLRVESNTGEERSLAELEATVVSAKEYMKSLKEVAHSANDFLEHPSYTSLPEFSSLSKTPPRY